MRFDLPEGLKLVHEMRIAVRWGDLDAMGHVNNTIYFRYFESLRIEWLAQVGALPSWSARTRFVVWQCGQTMCSDSLMCCSLGAGGRFASATPWWCMPCGPPAPAARWGARR